MTELANRATNNSKMCIIKKTFFNIKKIFKASLRVDDLFLKFKRLMLFPGLQEVPKVITTDMVTLGGCESYGS